MGEVVECDMYGHSLKARRRQNCDTLENPAVSLGAKPMPWPSRRSREELVKS
jgi:hypothetical protein